MNRRKLPLVVSLMLAVWMLPRSAVAQVNPVNTESGPVGSIISSVDIQNLPVGRTADIIIQLNPGAGPTEVTVDRNGPVTLPKTFVAPDPNTEFEYKECMIGTLNIYGSGVRDPCDGPVLGSGKWGSPVTIDAAKFFEPLPPHTAALSRGFEAMPRWGLYASFGVGPALINSPADQQKTLFRLYGDAGLDVHLRHNFSMGPFFGVGWDKQELVASFEGTGETGTFAKNYQGLTDLSVGGRVGYLFHHIQFQFGAAFEPTYGRLGEVVGACTTPTTCMSSTFHQNQTLLGYDYFGRVSVPMCLTMESPFHFYSEWSRTGGLSGRTPGSTLVPNYSSNRIVFGIEYRWRD